MNKIESQVETLRFLNLIGLNKFSPVELFNISRSFSEELLGGMQGRLKPNSLKMIETKLVSPSEDFIRHQEGQHYQIIEIGGTNVYVAETTIENSKPTIVKENGSPVQIRRRLTKTKFESTEDFFSEILTISEPILCRRPIESLGIIYAFPAEIVTTTLGIDVNSNNKLPKEFEIKGINKKPVGAAFIEYLEQHRFDLSNLKTLVVENDTPAALLSVPDSKIGGIVGTGYNLAMSVKGRIINLECGGFSDVPQHLIAREVDQESDNKGAQFAEKQIAGKYLGIQLQYTLAHLQNHGIDLRKNNTNSDEFLDGATITYALEGDKNKLLEHLEGNLDNQAMAILKIIAKRLSYRSLQLLSTKLSTIIKTFPNEFKGRDVAIPIEGSVFWGIPGYQDEVRDLVSCETGKNIIFPRIDHAGALGATTSIVGIQEFQSHLST
ncbi:MAG: hypothetical protein ABII80_01395 [bacterium]